MFYPSNFYRLKLINARKNSYCCLILLIASEAIVSGVQNVGNVFKRQEFDDYRSCARNFEIHQDKIIRTEESKKMGAKYLNGKEVTSKDECVKFCCRTPSCNVFVLEEKVFNQQQGTCYLFECGSSENFKCKFTRHHNYSSAVFIASRPQLLLEDEIQFTQHERELTSLRHGENVTKSKNCHGSPKTAPAADQLNYSELSPSETSKNMDETVDESFRKSGRCSRFQFECRSSGECIAIYNACDGIPQCADHSDEDAELGCPTNVPISPKKSFEGERSIVERTTNDNILGRNAILEETMLKPVNVPYGNKNGAENSPANHITQSVDQNPVGRQRYNAPLKMNPWQPRLNQPFYRPSHNFNHKQNEINNPYNFGEYGNIELNSLYDGYNVNNYNYNSNGNENKNMNMELKSNVYQSNVNPWRNKIGLVPEIEPKNSEIFGNRGGPEYYYEENNVLSANKIPELGLSPENLHPKVYRNATVKLTSAEHGPKSTETVVATAASISTIVPVTTVPSAPSVSATSTRVNSLAPVLLKSVNQENKPAPSASINEGEEHHREDTNVSHSSERVNSDQNSHRKVEKQLSAELSPAQERYLDVRSEDYGYTQHPSGAFVSLSLGVCVTAIMIFVVAYRLKIVRKRIRRGKLPYAHDADFLVNGMYL